MKDPLYEITEQMGKKRAKAIDDFILSYIPKWQSQIMIKFPSIVNLFGWAIDQRPNWNEQASKLGTKMELKRWGKLVGTLTIIDNVYTNQQKGKVVKK